VTEKWELCVLKTVYINEGDGSINGWITNRVYLSPDAT